ncbi:MAG: molybdopterin-synthase adenylyltransferase MoeB, partial [Halanaerobiales bacterium]
QKLEVDPEVAAIRLNSDNVSSDKLEETGLKEGDEVEFIFFMGGGAHDFSEEEIERYSRHIILEELGGRGQQKIKEAKILVVGAGGLGSPVSYYLAAAGVGTLGLIDSDVVDRSNLQRQILHYTSDIGRPKVESAREKLAEINPNIELKTYNKFLNKDNVEEIIADYDVIVDGVDNFPARYLLNDACVLKGKTLIEAGVLKFEGQVMTIKPGEGPCYRCVFREPPAEGAIPSCQEAGILGAIAGTIGTLQATEALKQVTEIGNPLDDRLLIYDALALSFREVKIQKDPDCPICGQDPQITELMEYELSCDIH